MNMKKCVVCGKEFKPKKGTQKYCGVECSGRSHANRCKARRDNCKKLHICTRCGMSLSEKDYQYFECVSCMEKKNRANRNKNKSVAQQDKLSAVLCEIDRYNKQSGKHLSYGQYIIKKERGEIK